jgi:hypothetical protein
MASFTDSIPQFNPYVQQLPVEAMVQVGMQKQKQYDEGIQKIQTNIDNIAGLEVTRDVDKAYLQSKLNQLGNDLTTVAAGDFSNFQLVNSVNGMTNQIVRDPNVQNAVSSSARRRKEYEFMEEARKKGELTPENQAYFTTRDSQWTNSTDLKQSYNARYVPYFDVLKHAKETIDGLKIDNFSFDEIYQKGPDGKYVTDEKGNLVLSPAMTRIKEEGYLPGKLEAAIDQIFNDPRVNQQLTISGEYSYRGVNPDQLAISVTSEANKIKEKYEDKLDELNIQLQLDPNNDEIKKQITNTELSISKLGENLAQTGEILSSNPNAIRASLYKNKTKENYTAMFDVSKTSKEKMANPEWDANFKLQQEANRVNEFTQRETRERWEFKQDYEQKERFKIIDQKTELEKAKLKVGATADTMTPELNQDSESQDFNDIMYHTNQVEDAASNMKNNQLELIWQSVFASGNEARLSSEMKKQYNGAPITRTQAIENILKVTAKSKNKSYDDYVLSLTSRVQGSYNTPKARMQLKKQNPALYDQLGKYDEANKNWKIQSTIDKNVQENSDGTFLEKMNGIPFQEKNIRIGDRTYTLTKRDAIDLAIIGKYEDKDWKAKIIGTKEAKVFNTRYQAAKSRLERSGKGELVENWISSFTPSKEKREILDKKMKEDLNKYGRINTVGFMTPYYVKDSGFRDVYKFYDSITNDSFKDDSEKIAASIRKYRSVVPNVSGSFTTGDDKSDKILLENLKGIVNTYSKNKNAIGQNAEDLIDEIKIIKNFQELRSANIIKGVEKDASGTPTPFIQIGDNKLYLNSQESQKFGINPSSIYDDEIVLATESLINSNNGKSSYGDINKTSTYRQESAPMDNTDFPFLTGTNYVVKVNFKKSQNKYYPYIYINNGKVDKVIPMEASDANLGKLMREVLPSYVSPPVLEQLLNKY